MEPVNQLLALCACVECSPARLDLIGQAAAQVSDWTDVPALAETQGLSPLLLKHLSDAGVEIPKDQRRELKLLGLRHRYAHEARFTALQEIILAFKTENIRLILLKGAALCHLLYPEPGLRPMSDLDVLVDAGEVLKAQEVLATLGYHVSSDPSSVEEHRHLPPATKQEQGFTISVELHHDLYDEDSDLSREQDELDFKKLYAEALPISAADGSFQAFGLGYESMLYHLCRHLVDNNDGFGPLRMIWFADITGFAARYHDRIDWALLNEKYPLVIGTLAILSALAPLPEVLRDRVPVSPRFMPSNPGEDYSGWPTVSLGRGRNQNYIRILKDTFSPPEWWLRLRYGLGCSRSTARARVKHALHIFRLASSHSG